MLASRPSPVPTFELRRVVHLARALLMALLVLVLTSLVLTTGYEAAIAPPVDSAQSA